MKTKCTVHYLEQPCHKCRTENLAVTRSDENFEVRIQQRLEERIAELPTDPAVLLRLLEQRHLLELLAWEACPEFVALKRAITAPIKRWQCRSLDGGATMEAADDGDYVRYEDAIAVRSERGRLEAAALDAAFAFIDSHVADPDITEEMRHKYAVYKEARAALEAPRSERDRSPE